MPPRLFVDHRLALGDLDLPANAARHGGGDIDGPA
jgi:hypothetical protein